MARRAFEAINEGLEDAIAFIQGDERRGIRHKIKLERIDIRQLRKRLKLTQEEFAQLFAVSLATLRNWEQGRRSPVGPANVLLNIIQRKPQIVLKILLQ
jgi:putative transcriptional regulator